MFLSARAWSAACILTRCRGELNGILAEAAGGSGGGRRSSPRGCNFGPAASRGRTRCASRNATVGSGRRNLTTRPARGRENVLRDGGRVPLFGGGHRCSSRIGRAIAFR